MRRILFLAFILCFALPNLAQEDTLTPYEIALQRIQEAEASGATFLDLSQLGLTELPPEIGSLVNLQHLYLSYNQISNLPPEIANLGNLQALDLSYNHLNKLPPEISNLSSLGVLELSNNELTSLPSEISRLSNLCYLSLWNNNFREVPLELALLKHSILRDCVNLGGFYLDLDPNLLNTLPNEVVAGGTPAILDYLENEAWWHLQRLSIYALGVFSLSAIVFLGMRRRYRGKEKRKQKPSG